MFTHCGGIGLDSSSRFAGTLVAQLHRHPVPRDVQADSARRYWLDTDQLLGRGITVVVILRPFQRRREAGAELGGIDAVDATDETGEDALICKNRP